MAVAAMMRENPSAKRIVKRKLVDRECIVDLGAFYILVIDQLDVDKVIDLNAKASGPAMIKSICHYARYNVLQLFLPDLQKIYRPAIQKTPTFFALFLSQAPV